MITSFKLLYNKGETLGEPLPSATVLQTGVVTHRGHQYHDISELESDDTVNDTELTSEQGHHDLYVPSIQTIHKVLNNNNVLKKSREMFRKDDYYLARIKCDNGWRYYIKSATVKNISYRVEVKWSHQFSEKWEESFVYSCTCPATVNCKHMGVMMMHLAQR